MYCECGNAAQVCRHFGIPRRTFWLWKRRYDPFDLPSLECRSRRPTSSPKRTSHAIEVVVLSVKRKHPRSGKEKIAFVVRQQGIVISGKTVWKILDRHRLIVPYWTRKRRSSKPRLNRAEMHVPRDLVEVDTKYVSLHGRQLYQYTLIDAKSRWRYADIHPTSDIDMKTTIAFLTNALKRSPAPFRVVQTDNGHEFGRAVSRWLGDRHIRHVFTHKVRPQENGLVERSHRIDEEEFYSMGWNRSTLTELRENFAKYMQMYNTERPHWGLNGLTPQQYLANYSLSKPCQMS